MGYAKNLLVSIDQLGNTLCGGDPDNTISARIGYFTQAEDKTSKWYWKTLRSFVNITFWPVDGPGHCAQAYEADPRELFSRIKNFFARVLLMTMVILTCVPIGSLLYFLFRYSFLTKAFFPLLAVIS